MGYILYIRYIDSFGDGCHGNGYRPLPKNRVLAITGPTVKARALILGLITPIVGSIFHFMVVAIVTDVGHYQKIEFWP